ncbi:MULTISPECIES: hypothetical protein [Klebsiella/Raoultella group]|uniref:hypothetical protein n=1 Tax=Klebsiella/Raoultella group TaxID=2890311 RepID=UPI00164B3236|nr:MULTISPECIES: hypothetical protein [Klebsiella/Raoultella group]MBC4754933.1 hypothetical protein [Klebsiella variicola]MDV1448282.1 hypothetical protein [Raoultella planticola]MDV1563994.1 hypothetical protein [Raoultella planticola]MDV1570572.1 hypothetical protein [Raoultella planticola]MDV1630853.1 hypothetical protein [Raoultella planticola]
MKNVLSEQITAALEHQGAHLRFDGNGDVTQAIPVTPASVRYLSLNEVLSPRSGAQTTLNAALIANSLVVAAGANVLRIPGPMTQQPDIDAAGNRREIRFEEVARHFLVTPAGKFEQVADGDEITLSGVPYLVASYDDSTAPSYGIGYTLTRQQLKHTFSDPDTVLRSVNIAIEAGIARLADAVLLAHLESNASTLADSNVTTIAAAAAAKGLRWAGLSAVAGTSATGVTLDSTGKLRVAGVAAELTDTITGSVIGAFDRAAVAIDDEIRLTVRRTDNAGVEIVTWVTASPLVPDASAFWKL